MSYETASREFRKLILHFWRKLDAQERTFIPEGDPTAGIFRTARIWTVIYVAVIGMAIWKQGIMPFVYVGLPTFYGVWLLNIFGLTQHAGLLAVAQFEFVAASLSRQMAA